MESNPMFWIIPVGAGVGLIIFGISAYLFFDNIFLSAILFMLGVLVISIGISAVKLVLPSKKGREKAIRHLQKGGFRRPDWSDPYKYGR